MSALQATSAGVKDITQDYLKKILDYNIETGVFTWLVSPSKPVRIGSKAGSIDKQGYVCIKIKKRIYKAHRLAWLYVTGKWPEMDIDHKNTVTGDNRFCNLRELSNSLNQQNKVKARVDSKTKVLGVSKKGDKFIARIQLNKKRIYLGEFETVDLARIAYNAEKAKLHIAATFGGVL